MTPTTPSPVEPEEVKAIRERHEADTRNGRVGLLEGAQAARDRATLLNLLGDKEGWRDQIRREAFEEAIAAVENSPSWATEEDAICDAVVRIRAIAPITAGKE